MARVRNDGERKPLVGGVATVERADGRTSTPSRGKAKLWPGDIADVPDDVAQTLIERYDFVAVDDADTDATLNDLSKDELYELAVEADIEGRSSMTKDELITALSGD